MSNPAFAAIILAAGEGTRLNSAIPKVLHELAGWPLIRHVTEALRPLGPAETGVVIGQGMEAVARAAAPAKTAIQSPPRGTGDAVRAARAGLEARLAQGAIADVVALFGGAALVAPRTGGAPPRRAGPHARRCDRRRRVSPARSEPLWPLCARPGRHTC